MNNPHGNSRRFRVKADSMEPVSRQAHYILLAARNKEQIPLRRQLFQSEAIIFAKISGIQKPHLRVRTIHLHILLCRIAEHRLFLRRHNTERFPFTVLTAELLQ